MASDSTNCRFQRCGVVKEGYYSCVYSDFPALSRGTKATWFNKKWKIAGGDTVYGGVKTGKYCEAYTDDGVYFFIYYLRNDLAIWQHSLTPWSSHYSGPVYRYSEIASIFKERTWFWK